jgi:hypothetical protein
MVNLESPSSKLPLDVAKDVGSLHFLLTSLLTHSPHYFTLERSVKDKVENFLTWMHAFQEHMQELESLESSEDISLKLLYESLARIHLHAENVETFVDEFFEKHRSLIEPTDSLADLFEKASI